MTAQAGSVQATPPLTLGNVQDKSDDETQKEYALMILQFNTQYQNALIQGIKTLVDDFR